MMLAALDQEGEIYRAMLSHCRRIFHRFVVVVLQACGNGDRQQAAEHNECSSNLAEWFHVSSRLSMRVHV